MMRQELFSMVKAILEKTVPEVKHIALWNHNVEFIEQEDAWARPAVFVEFGTITWEPFNGKGRRGKGTVRIHLVTDWSEGEYEAAFALCRKIHTEIEGIDGDEFSSLSLVATDTNHNHEEILESIDTYAVRYLLAE